MTPGVHRWTACGGVHHAGATSCQVEGKSTARVTFSSADETHGLQSGFHQTDGDSGDIRPSETLYGPSLYMVPSLNYHVIT